MSISLTWANYALIISVCLGVYYAVVGFIFYRMNIKLAFSDVERKAASAADTDNSSLVESRNQNLFGEETDESVNFNNEEADFNPEAQDFADEIVAYTSSCEEGITKEKLIHSIRRIIQKYPSLKDSEQRYELTQLIAISAENHCSIHVSADELSELWRS